MTDQDTNEALDRLLAVLDVHAEALIKGAMFEASVNVSDSAVLEFTAGGFFGRAEWSVRIVELGDEIRKSYWIKEEDNLEEVQRACWSQLKHELRNRIKGAQVLLSLVSEQ